MNTTSIDSMKVTLKELELQWNRMNLNNEIGASMKSRVIQDVEERKIVEYSTSSANRRRFMMYACRAGYEKAPMTYEELAKLLGVRKDTLSLMWKECSEAGWIITTEAKRSKQTMIASPKMLECYNNYSEWVRYQCHQGSMRQVATAIWELKNLIEAAEIKNAE